MVDWDLPYAVPVDLSTFLAYRLQFGGDTLPSPIYKWESLKDKGISIQRLTNKDFFSAAEQEYLEELIELSDGIRKADKNIFLSESVIKPDLAE